MTSDGTEPDGLGHRHRRAHAERARLVARRRHDAAAVGLAADRQRLAAQRRVVALLDRRVERVHVDVKDPAHRAECSVEIVEQRCSWRCCHAIAIVNWPA